ncbi:hypothetical protein [Streptomyces aurantiogriseus]|uniref:Uncharacterized protein n=1 Tax=Streptomyces aurantiogriseus TaxID=66870 RepID=A0A918FNU9_9ACTN|nr:hypothetical protein [Streptomyces aurantiogriseus]GGR61028.1 hypothetical protein GCM10010251_92150 [Streptomyces aurantiogriseus]
MNDEYEPEEMDIADEVAFADTGRSWAHRVIKHPVMRATRRHLAEQPLPQQRQIGGAA